MFGRRDFLAGTAAVAATAVPMRAAARSAAPMPLDMPAPDDTLPRPQAPADPSLWRLDTGWLFHLGDIVPPPVIGHEESYQNAKAGIAQGAAAIGYDDSDWRTVELPHDWAIEAPVDPAANVAQGYRRRGIGWYRRTLELDPAWRGKYLELQLGAIATNATVWVNGIAVAHSFSGYTRVDIDITPYARFGDEVNVVAIRVDAETMEGWWYEGAGLYRHNGLAVRDPVHIATDGIHADPRHDGGTAWHVPIAITVANIAETPVAATIEATLVDDEGRTIAQGHTEMTLAPLGGGEGRIALAVTDPRLWSPDHPTLYQVHTALAHGGVVVDRRTTTIGFRTFRFDPATGFKLNGEPLKIKGVCVHQDHAGVGVAVPDSLWDWRVRRLKALGCNALRSSHHAPSPALLDACDRHGLLVMDENRNFNPSPTYLHQLEWLVRRDRNRPSVFMWSVFNEEPMQGTEQGYEMVRRMAAAVKALDDSRPVTAAMNDGMFAPRNVSQAVDVIGFNYQHARYDPFHAAHPDRPLTSSEDTSAFMTRGEWRTDRERHLMSSYDNDAADWGATHADGWRHIAERPFVAGTFVWTGFDYHGEPTPFEWPSTSSFFGIMDLCGFAKMAFHLHRAQWIDMEPVLSLAPHWNWAGREGTPIRVIALTNVERVELWLNGHRIGVQAVDRLAMPEWQVPYAPGRLEAVGFRGGREVARTLVETTGAPVALRLTPDRTRMLGIGSDVQPVTVDAVDEQGRHVPTANLPATFVIRGGSIVGLGNGDPNDHDPEQGHARRLFNGLAQVIVRAPAGRGAVVLSANAPGLRSARLTVPVVEATTTIPAIDDTRPVAAITDWKRTEFSAEPPDPRHAYAGNDMNSLFHARPGRLEGPGAGPWSMYRTTIVPRRPVAERGGTVVFAEVVGRAEAWIDGVLAARKSEFAAAPLVVPLAPGAAPRTLSLLVEAAAGARSGIGRTVAVQERP